MRIFPLLFAFAAVSATVVSGNNSYAEKQKPAKSSNSQDYYMNETPEDVKGSTLSGKIVETMNSGGYTYLCLEKDGKKSWAVILETKVNVGEEIALQPGYEMVNFTSKTLNLMFDKIVFSTGLAPQQGEACKMGFHGKATGYVICGENTEKQKMVLFKEISTHSDGKPKEYVFYMEDVEIAKETYDEEGNRIEIVGTIPEGICRSYYSSGKLERVLNYRDNKREGIDNQFAENGVLISEREYKDNKLNGKFKSYYDNGQLESEGYNANGFLDGMCKLYHKNGNVSAEINFRNGQIIERKLYYENGDLRHEMSISSSRVENRYYKKGDVPKNVNKK